MPPLRPTSPNFAFLAVHDPLLPDLPALAERAIEGESYRRREAEADKKSRRRAKAA